MEYRNLGRSGLQVSVIGLGCNNFGRRTDLEGTRAVVSKALDSGINLLDTADVYGGAGMSEQFLGQVLEGRRHEVVLATKFANPMGEGPMNRGGSRRYIMAAVEASLKRLNTDYIDLYQMHVPDAKTPIEETLRAMDDLVRQGKVRYIGHSNFAGWQAAEAHYVAEKLHTEPFVSAQNEYNLLNRRIERELVPACRRYGLGVLPYFPLASGFLTGKYQPDQPLPEGARLSGAAAAPMANAILTPKNYETLAKLEAFAAERGKSVTELAFAWLASQDFVASVIAGATRPEQVEENVAAGVWRLSPEEMVEVDQITK